MPISWYQENPETRGKEHPEIKVKERKRLAKRRVKLGLFVAHIGKINNIDADEEVKQFLLNQASQYPGQRRSTLICNEE